MNRNIIKDWEPLGYKFFVRKSLNDELIYAVVMGYDGGPYGAGWRYQLTYPDKDSILNKDEQQKLVASCEEAQKIVDALLEEIGLEPITDKLRILLDK